MTPRLPQGSPAGSPNPARQTRRKRSAQRSTNWTDMINSTNNAASPYHRARDGDTPEGTSVNWADLVPAVIRPGSSRRPDTARRPESSRRPESTKRPASSRRPETSNSSSAYAAPAFGRPPVIRAPSAPATATATATQQPAEIEEIDEILAPAPAPAPSKLSTLAPSGTKQNNRFSVVGSRLSWIGVPANRENNNQPKTELATKRKSLGHRLSTGGLQLLEQLGETNGAFTDIRFPVEDDIEFERTLKRTGPYSSPSKKEKPLYMDDLKSSALAESFGAGSRDISRNTSENRSVNNSGNRSMNKSGRSGRSAASTAMPDAAYPPLRQAMLVLIGIYFAIFLIALDRTILGTAIPQMTDEFKSFEDIGWYQSAYMLTLAAFQLFFGRFYTFYSPKWTYVMAIALFEIGSAICGAASSSTMFIVGRAIAGIGSGGTFSGSLVLLMNLLPLSQRAVAMGLIGACFGIASVVGPLVGGVFTTYATWRWCFYINLPIGAVTMIIVLVVVRMDAPMAARGKSLREKILQLDPLGNLLFITSVVCLLLALQWAGTVYAWGNARIIVLLIIFVLTFGAWIASQMLRPKELVLVPRHVMRNRSILAGMWYAFFCNPAMVISALYLPVYFQAIKGVNAVESGIRIIPLVLGMVVMIIGSGILTGKIGYYTPFMIAGSIIAPIGAGLLTTIKVNTGNGLIIGYQIITGVGIGLGVQQSMLAAQTVLPRRDGPQGSSLMILCQMLGGSVFASISQSVLAQTLVRNVQDLNIPGVTTNDIVNAGATQLKNLVPSLFYPSFLEAYNKAITAALTVSVATACLSLLGAVTMEWKNTKTNKAKMAAARAAEKTARSGHKKSSSTSRAEVTDRTADTMDHSIATEELAGNTLTMESSKSPEQPMVMELARLNADLEAGKRDIKDVDSTKSWQD